MYVNPILFINKTLKRSDIDIPIIAWHDGDMKLLDCVRQSKYAEPSITH